MHIQRSRCRPPFTEPPPSDPPEEAGSASRVGARAFWTLYIRNLLGWLETRLAQIALNLTSLNFFTRQVNYFKVVKGILRRVGAGAYQTPRRLGKVVGWGLGFRV